MNIKTKLRFGFGFLFGLVLLIGAVAAIYLKEISNTSRVILKDNFESLRYSGEMHRILDENDLPLSPDVVKQFKNLLKLQARNVTEPGEKKLTEAISKDFNTVTVRAVQNPSNIAVIKNLHRNIRKIEKINMQAIVKKNSKAQDSVKEAILYLGVFGSVTFMVLFSFIINFPGFIANPLQELTQGIREISNKNYQMRLDFPAYNEFGELAGAFNQMAARLNEWENSNLAKVMSEKLRIETIIEKMEDAILGLNEGQQIIFINPTAKKLLGISEQQIKNYTAAQLAAENDLLKSVLEAKDEDKPIKIYAGGKETYYQLESHKILVPQYTSENHDTVAKTGEFAGDVYILRNITRFKELDQAKTNFIATISHELKTPISSIQLSLKLLNDDRVGTLNPEQHELLTHIKNDSIRLLKITSELLDLSQIETGNIQLSFVPTDPAQIVEYAIGSVKFQADQKQVELQYISDPHLPAVHADVEKTAWVLVNFLSNAIRYSPAGSKVIINVKASDKMVEFSVKDFGEGIDEQYQRKIFDKYFRVPTPEKEKAGTGLGLAIAKDFIVAQKGEIFVQSQRGSGSRFGFTLPVV